MTSLHVSRGLGIPNQKTWLCLWPLASKDYAPRPPFAMPFATGRKEHALIPVNRLDCAAYQLYGL